MKKATGIHLPPATLDRVVKGVAAEATALRQKLDGQARLGGEALARQSVGPAPETLIIMMDAWLIRERDDWGKSQKLRQKGLEPKRWHYVWTGTVFGLDKRLRKGDRAIISSRGYAATMEGADALSQQLYAEALRHVTDRPSAWSSSPTRRPGFGRSRRIVSRARFSGRTFTM